MFAGITIINHSEGDNVLGMESRENEKVDFVKPFTVSEDPAINVWLSKTEYQMQFSLASLLESCVS